MKILVLGANGQLGSDLMRARETVAESMELVPVTRREMDVAAPESIRTCLAGMDFQAAINCTAYNRTDDAESHATEAFAINAHAPPAIAAACREKGARLVHVSTDWVFDGESRTPYRETDLPGPINVYGASKALGERLALRAHPDTLILRGASLFGIAGSSGKGGNFVETIVKKAREQQQLQVVDDIVMSPTSTRDLAEMILTLLAKKAPTGIYHAVNSGQASWCEFAREIVTQCGIAAEVLPVASDAYPTVAARPAFTVLDNGKISRLCGEIRHWKEGLRQYLQEKGYLAV